MANKDIYIDVSVDDKEKLAAVTAEATIAQRALEDLQAAYDNLPPGLKALLTDPDPRQSKPPEQEQKPL